MRDLRLIGVHDDGEHLVVIGSGATAVTLVPAMAPQAASVIDRARTAVATPALRRRFWSFMMVVPSVEVTCWE